MFSIQIERKKKLGIVCFIIVAHSQHDCDKMGLMYVKMQKGVDRHSNANLPTVSDWKGIGTKEVVLQIPVSVFKCFWYKKFLSTRHCRIFWFFLHIFHKSDYFNACNFGLYLVIYIVPWWFTISHLFSWFLWWDQVIGKLSIFAKYEYLKREIFGKFSHFCIFFYVETWFINFTKDCVLITKSHFENAPPPPVDYPFKNKSKGLITYENLMF